MCIAPEKTLFISLFFILLFGRKTGKHPLFLRFDIPNGEWDDLRKNLFFTGKEYPRFTVKESPSLTGKECPLFSFHW